MAKKITADAIVATYATLKIGEIICAEVEKLQKKKDKEDKEYQRLVQRRW